MADTSSAEQLLSQTGLSLFDEQASATPTAESLASVSGLDLTPVVEPERDVGADAFQAWQEGTLGAEADKARRTAGMAALDSYFKTLADSELAKLHKGGDPALIRQLPIEAQRRIYDAGRNADIEWGEAVSGAVSSMWGLQKSFWKAGASVAERLAPDALTPDVVNEFLVHEGVKKPDNVSVPMSLLEGSAEAAVYEPSDMAAVAAQGGSALTDWLFETPVAYAAPGTLLTSGTYGPRTRDESFANWQARLDAKASMARDKEQRGGEGSSRLYAQLTGDYDFKQTPWIDDDIKAVGDALTIVNPVEAVGGLALKGLSTVAGKTASAALKGTQAAVSKVAPKLADAPVEVFGMSLSKAGLKGKEGLKDFLGAVDEFGERLTGVENLGNNIPVQGVRAPFHMALSGLEKTGDAISAVARANPFLTSRTPFFKRLGKNTANAEWLQKIGRSSLGQTLDAANTLALPFVKDTASSALAGGLLYAWSAENEVEAGQMIGATAALGPFSTLSGMAGHPFAKLTRGIENRINDASKGRFLAAPGKKSQWFQSSRTEVPPTPFELRAMVVQAEDTKRWYSTIPEDQRPEVDRMADPDFWASRLDRLAADAQDDAAKERYASQAEEMRRMTPEEKEWFRTQNLSSIMDFRIGAPVRARSAAGPVELDVFLFTPEQVSEALAETAAANGALTERQRAEILANQQRLVGKGKYQSLKGQYAEGSDSFAQAWAAQVAANAGGASFAYLDTNADGKPVARIAINADLLLKSGYNVWETFAHEKQHTLDQLGLVDSPLGQVLETALFGNEAVDPVTGRRTMIQQGSMTEAELGGYFTNYLKRAGDPVWALNFVKSKITDAANLTRLNTEFATTVSADGAQGLKPDRITPELVALMDPSAWVPYARSEVRAEVAAASYRDSTRNLGGLGGFENSLSRRLIDWAIVTEAQKQAGRIKTAMARVIKAFGGELTDHRHSSLLKMNVSPLLRSLHRQFVEASRAASSADKAARDREEKAQGVTPEQVAANPGAVEYFKNAPDLFEVTYRYDITDEKGNTVATPVMTRQQAEELGVLPKARFEVEKLTGGKTRFVPGEGRDLHKPAVDLAKLLAEAERQNGAPLPKVKKFKVKAVSEEIARDQAGKPTLLSKTEIQRRLSARAKLVERAIRDAAQDGSPSRMVETTPGHWAGVPSVSQVTALLSLDDIIFPAQLKQNLATVWNIITGDHGGRVQMEYQAALKDGRYASLSPKFRDAAVQSIHLSKAGNLLLTDVSASRIYDKLYAWADTGRLAPWGNDVESAFQDLVGYLGNHKNGIPGATGLDPNPDIAVQKRNILNDLLNLFDKETRASNPDRKSGKSDIDRVIASRRLDRITRIYDNSGNLVALPIYLDSVKKNFVPASEDATEPVTLSPLRPASLAGVLRPSLSSETASFMPSKSEGIPELQEWAEKFAGRALEYDYLPLPPAEVMKARADVQQDAVHEPENPAVRASYDALASDLLDQYQNIVVRSGIRVEIHDERDFEGKITEPYKGAKDMMAKVKESKVIKFLKTDTTSFGDGSTTKHPMLEAAVDGSGRAITAKNSRTGQEEPLLWNDLFRAVHDLLGHGLNGTEFGPRGEFNAWKAHSALFSPLAQPALAAETLDQNAYVNNARYLRRPDGSLPVKGDLDYVPLSERRFADQKAYLADPSEHGLLNPADIEFADSESRAAPVAADVSFLPGGDTLVGPTSFNIRAWHGTPHRIGTRFDLSKIGTGEGAQAYGWGLYFAGSKAVAKTYAGISPAVGALPPPRYTLRGVEVEPGSAEYHAARLIQERGVSLPSNRKWAREWVKELEAQPERGTDLAHARKVKETMDSVSSRKDVGLLPSGNLYEVNILADEDKMLDWDKPLKDQPDAVQKALAKIAPDFFDPLADDYDADEQGQMTYQRLVASGKKRYYSTKPLPDTSSWEVERVVETNDPQSAAHWVTTPDGLLVRYAPKETPALEVLASAARDFHFANDVERVSSPKETSETLRDAGLHGIKYLDGNSRTKGKGTRNYVLFDDALVQVVSRNGTTQFMPAAGADANDPAEIKDAAKQWALNGTNSPYFQKWFRDSQAVKADGTPERFVARAGGVLRPESGVVSGLPGFGSEPNFMPSGDRVSERRAALKAALREKPQTEEYQELEERLASITESLKTPLPGYFPPARVKSHREMQNQTRSNILQDMALERRRAGMYDSDFANGTKVDPLSLPKVHSGRSFWLSPDGELIATEGEMYHDRFFDATGVDKDEAIELGWRDVHVDGRGVFLRSDDEVTKAQKRVLEDLTFSQNSPVFRDWRGESLGNIFIEAPEAPDGSEPNYLPAGTGETRDGFFSQLGRTLDEKFQGKTATADQVKGVINNPQNRVRADEIKWSGIMQKVDELAAQNGGKVPMEALREWFANSGRVKFTEVTMGGDTSAEDKRHNDWVASERERINAASREVSRKAFQKARDKWESEGRAEAARGDLYGSFNGVSRNTRRVDELWEAATPSIVGSWDTLILKMVMAESPGAMDEIRALSAEMGALPDFKKKKDETVYGQYTLPGGENYREIILQFPKPVPSFEQWVVENITPEFQTGAENETVNRRVYDSLVEDGKVGNGEFKPDYYSPHFNGTPDYLAHMRLKDRADAEGRKGTFIEELQSDRHQAGRDSGYAEPDGDAKRAEELKGLDAEFRNNLQLEKDHAEKGAALYNQIKEDVLEQLRKEQPRFAKARVADLDAYRPAQGSLAYEVQIAAGLRVLRASEQSEALKTHGVEGRRLKQQREEIAQKINANKQFNVGKTPDAPFRKDWALALFKRVLRDAVEAGHEWVGWATGDTQNKRFSLSNVIDDLQWTFNPQTRTGDLLGSYQGDVKVDRENVSEKDLPQYVRAEVAQRLLAQTPQPYGVSKNYQVLQLSGEDLEVGGEGMKGFYDDILVKEVNKYVKQWGAKVEPSTVPLQPLDDYVKKVYGSDVGSAGWEIPGILERNKGLKESWIKSSKPIHKILITPAMRQSVQAGQPAFLPATGWVGDDALTLHSSPADFVNPEVRPERAFGKASGAGINSTISKPGAERYKEAVKKAAGAGFTYQLRLRNAKTHYLDLNIPVEDQPPVVLAALLSSGVVRPATASDRERTPYVPGPVLKNASWAELADYTNGTLFGPQAQRGESFAAPLYYGLSQALGGDDKASAFLRQQGILGHTWDESRVGGAEEFDFLTYHPDDARMVRKEQFMPAGEGPQAGDTGYVSAKKIFDMNNDEDFATWLRRGTEPDFFREPPKAWLKNFGYEALRRPDGTLLLVDPAAFGSDRPHTEPDQPPKGARKASKRLKAGMEDARKTVSAKEAGVTSLKALPKTCSTPGCQNLVRMDRGKPTGPLCNSCRSKVNRERNPLTTQFTNLKGSAKKRGKEFTLTLDEFEELVRESDYYRFSGLHMDQLTIDRIDPSGPYSKENTRVLTNRDNSGHKREDEIYRADPSEMEFWKTPAPGLLKAAGFAAIRESDGSLTRLDDVKSTGENVFNALDDSDMGLWEGDTQFPTDEWLLTNGYAAMRLPGGALHIPQEPASADANASVPQTEVAGGDPAFMPAKGSWNEIPVQFESETKLKGALKKKALDLVHFSSVPLKVLDPKKSFGKGEATAIDQRGGPVGFFYTNGTTYEGEISQRPYAYGARVSGSALYDYNADPLDVRSIVNVEKRYDKLKELGFAGYKGSTVNFDAVVMFEPVKLTPVEKSDIYTPEELKAMDLEDAENTEPEVDTAAVDKAFADWKAGRISYEELEKIQRQVTEPVRKFREQYDRKREGKMKKALAKPSRSVPTKGAMNKTPNYIPATEAEEAPLRDYRGPFHIEQDAEWAPERRASGKWAATDRKSAKTWSLYETVGSPAYQTLRKTFANEKEARAYLETLPAFTPASLATEADIKDLPKRTNWAILSPENPNAEKLPEVENAPLRAAFEDDLKARGIPYEPIRGSYGSPEKSYFLPDISEADALALGQKYGQQSVISPKGLVFQDGSYNALKDEVTIYDSEPEDFYSVGPGGIFSLQFDFDTKLDKDGKPVKSEE